MRSIVRWCAIWFTAVLAACATSPDIAPAPAFDLTGRMVVRFQNRGFTSAVRWTQNDGADEIWLTAPLGQTIAYLRADRDGATLTAADQRQYHASSIEHLTQSAFGWRFPVAGMRHWVFGQAAPGMTTAALERDDANRITRLSQDDWQVAFNYTDPGRALPSRVDAASADAEIRFVIDALTMPQP
jgi:outer membrane lipoprotein LolB